MYLMRRLRAEEGFTLLCCLGVVPRSAPEAPSRAFGRLWAPVGAFGSLQAPFEGGPWCLLGREGRWATPMTSPSWSRPCFVMIETAPFPRGSRHTVPFALAKSSLDGSLLQGAGHNGGPVGAPLDTARRCRLPHAMMGEGLATPLVSYVVVGRRVL